MISDSRAISTISAPQQRNPLCKRDRPYRTGQSEQIHGILISIHPLDIPLADFISHEAEEAWIRMDNSIRFSRPTKSKCRRMTTDARSNEYSSAIPRDNSRYFPSERAARTGAFTRYSLVPTPWLGPRTFAPSVRGKRSSLLAAAKCEPQSLRSLIGEKEGWSDE